jgi:hypothetical protein
MKKSLLAAIIILVLAAGGAWYYFDGASYFAAEKHIILGTLGAEGDYVYAEDMPYYLVDVYYPAKTPLGRSADRAARLTMEQGLLDLVNQFKNNGQFESLTAEDVAIQGLGPDRKYALAIEYKEYTSPKYVSYVYSIYEDTLGAHPNGYFKTYTFNKKGEALPLAGLFKPESDYLARIAPLATAEVERLITERGGEGAADGLFREGLSPTVENYSSFHVDGDNLIILFPPYQVAAYAVGVFTVRIPLSQLSDILQ